MDDKTLLTLLEQDPEQGIQSLWEQYFGVLQYAAAQRISSIDDVRECVHETLTDFYFQRDRFDRTKGSLRAYLIAIVDRKAIQRFWDTQHRRIAEEQAIGNCELREDWEQIALLHEALAELPLPDRQVLELRYFHGYTAREIAATLGLEHETVKKRQQRALKKLMCLMHE